ncbi:MAG: transaldolase [Actinomycetota bacterium]
MTSLHNLFEMQGQSPWIDNLQRSHLRDGTLRRHISDGVRGLTSNPTIFQKAIQGGSDYDEQFASLVADHVKTSKMPATFSQICIEQVTGRMVL